VRGVLGAAGGLPGRPGAEDILIETAWRLQYGVNECYERVQCNQRCNVTRMKRCGVLARSFGGDHRVYFWWWLACALLGNATCTCQNTAFGMAPCQKPLHLPFSNIEVTVLTNKTANRVSDAEATGMDGETGKETNGYHLQAEPPTPP
jgi:hypothetical protein